MDKRTSLAIVIMLGLTLVWSMLSKSPEPEQATTDPVDVVVDHVSNVSHQANNNVEAVSPTVTAPTAESRFIAGNSAPTVVETDNYTLTIDPAGAEITSWVGNKFKGVAGADKVELIPEGYTKPIGSSDVIKFERGEISLAGAWFESSSPSIVKVRDTEQIRFEAHTKTGITIGKTFTFNNDTYDYQVSYDVDTTSPDIDSETSIQLGRPVSAKFGWYQGIAETENAVKTMATRSLHSFRSFAMVGDEPLFLKQKDLDESNSKAFGLMRGSFRFAGIQNKYFMIASFLPNTNNEAHEASISLGGDPVGMQQTFAVEIPFYNSSTSISYYVGPSDFEALEKYNCSLEKAVNLGWKWITPISTLMLRIMNWLHKFIPNYGVVIVVISILSKLVFFPLTDRGTKSMKKMQESQARLKPKMDALKKKCAGDSQKYNQEMMKLYKEEGVNPMAGMAGCLPMLIQMPVFIALYQVLYNMVDLRFTPFFGWITDLSQPDALFALPFTLPLLGSSFNLLPLIMAAATWYQGKLTPHAAGQGQMAAMQNIMPIMMLLFLYNMPSGLVIYWTINTAMTAMQTWSVNRKSDSEKEVVAS